MEDLVKEGQEYLRQARAAAVWDVNIDRLLEVSCEVDGPHHDHRCVDLQPPTLADPVLKM